MNRYNFILFLVILSVALLFCKTEPQTIESSIYGIWEMSGYGKLIEIDSSKIKLYDITKISCIPIKTIELKDSAILGKRIALRNDSMILKFGVTNYLLKRLPHLTKQCTGNDSVKFKDPVYNFEVFWNTFSEYYSCFKERNINWNNIYHVYKSKISKSTTEKELYTILSDIVDQLGDGHTSLDAPEAVERKISQKKEHGDSLKSLREAILKKYLKSYKSAGRDMLGKGLVNWGVTKENVGYLQVNWMIFYADYAIPDTIKGNAFSERYIKSAENDLEAYQKEIREVDKIMNEVIIDFRHVDSVILDIRMNGGGYDGVALEILNHFTKERTFAFSKKARLGQGYTRPQKIFLLPSKETFSGPVFLLTSNCTGSAAEVLTLSSMALKNIIRIGSITYGIFSDVLEKKLPNGWKFTLSNEVYQNALGKNFESIGIPPDINLKYPQDEDEFYRQLMKEILAGDRAVDKALEKTKKL